MTDLTSFPLRLNTKDIVIASSTTVSAAIDLFGNRLVGFIIPATFTGASFTIQASVDNTNFHDLYDESGNAISITATDGKMLLFEQLGMECFRYMKITSASTEAAARTVKAIIKP